MENINPTRAIVGFRSYFDLLALGSFPSSEAKAGSQLQIAPGYERVVEKLDRLNAVVVSVSSDRIHDFVSQVKSIDPVEYCDYDYLLVPSGYEELVFRDHCSAISLAKVLKKYHGWKTASAAAPAGLGVKVAVIDSGISPHPYLPALSAIEAKAKAEVSHPWLTRDHHQNSPAEPDIRTRDGLLNDLAALEDLTPSCSTCPTSREYIRNKFDGAVAAYRDNLWNDWQSRTKYWLSKQRRSSRPLMPMYRNVFGALRIISPASRSFVDDKSDPEASSLLDVDGHGSAMAGVFSSLSPRATVAYSDTADITIALDDDFELGVRGLAPFAELLVLKCMHRGGGKSLESSVIALIKAIAFAANEHVDVVYIGLSLSKAQHKFATALSRALKLLDGQGTVVIAPSGNDGANGINLPASLPDVLAISSVSDTGPNGSLTKSASSNSADAAFGESIAFCAFGGDSKRPVLLLSKDFGFTACYGTSVAAAIAAACYSSKMSELYAQSLNLTYDAIVGRTGGQIDFAKTRAMLSEHSVGLQELRQLTDQFRQRAVVLPGQTSTAKAEDYGAGLLCLF